MKDLDGNPKNIGFYLHGVIAVLKFTTNNLTIIVAASFIIILFPFL